MTNVHFFDYLKSAREAGIGDEDLRSLEQLFRADYPSDDMLYELHVLRACNAIRDGITTLDAILSSGADEDASAAWRVAAPPAIA